MAAAPRGADARDVVAGEARILQATRPHRLDHAGELTVHETPRSSCVARERPDVVQISCHGTLAPEPGLLLEDEIGEGALARTGALIGKLAAPDRRLLFLSACETAEAHPVLDSLARALVRAGAPAVLGWAAPVLDREATLFAAGLYSRLVQGDDLAQAHARARLELVEALRDEATGSRDWHLARLYLAPTGGGVLARADAPQRHLGQGQAVKTFLDAKGKQVPVASAQEFVGRRREIQKILREFRAPRAERQAGVFIHGVGRQGKSSLAARVAHRLEHTHETVVLYGRYDGPYLLGKLAERLGTPAVTDLVRHHLPLVEQDPSRLLPALTELLEGPCAQAGAPGARPVLLVIDDFEQALDDQNRRTLKPEYYESIRALLLAFQHAATESRLLFTCRYRFTCPHDGHDLADADHLLDVPLHGMNDREARKQADARLRLPDLARRVARLTPDRRKALEEQIARAITLARGNPGLQDLLFTLAVEHPDSCGRCLDQMEEFLRSGTLPAEDAIRKFLENLALAALFDLLTPAQREFLRAATLFELPVPAPVMAILGTPGRLLALGLMEVYEDLHDPQAPALALNALVRPLAGTLSETEQAARAGEVIGALFEHWGGATGGKRRGNLQDHELVRLGLLARDARVLAATGAGALRLLEDRFQFQQAAAWAKGILAILDAALVPASLNLLRTAAERCFLVGEVQFANALRERALRLLGQGGQTDTSAQASMLLTHARALVQQGQPDEALQHLERARGLFTTPCEQAIVLGEIAGIWANKGEIDAALRLHQERLDIFEALGAARERALALGDIARLWADKGEVDAALRLHQERLSIFKALGDKREGALALGDIAQIWVARGDVDAALQLHREEIRVYEALGDKRSRAVTLWNIARIRAAKGELDAALEMHQEEIGIYEALGEKRSRAVTLGDIARILATRGEIDRALQLHQERLGIFEALGDKRSRAVTLSDIARLRAAKGEVDAALQMHEEQIGIFEALGDTRSRASTLVDIARIRADKGEVNTALQLQLEAIAIYEALGDKRSRAVTLGELAQLRAAKGEVEAALRLQQERLTVNEGLGDQDGIAAASWDLAKLEMNRLNFPAAFPFISRAYEIFQQTGRLEGICFVGLSLGQLLWRAGQREEGIQVLTRSRDGFQKLGQAENARQTQDLLDQLSQAPPPS